MEANTDTQPTERTAEQESSEIYLPAMPSISGHLGTIERVVATLTRRRGGLRPVGRSGR